MPQDAISYLAVKKTSDGWAMEEEYNVVRTAWWLVIRGRLEMIWARITRERASGISLLINIFYPRVKNCF